MKVFVSSVMEGFEDYRAAACAAIESLDHEVIRAEDFPASASSSRIACLQGVRAADLVVLILGERYGWSETASGLSPTHEEFQEAIPQAKVIPFVQSGVTREPKQADFIREVEDYDTGLHRGRNFKTPEELRNEVTKALHRHELVSASVPVDARAMLAAAHAAIPKSERGVSRNEGPLIHVAVVGGPRQSILRPSEIEAEGTADRLVGLLTKSGFLTYRLGTQPRRSEGALVVSQENGAAVRIDEAAALLVSAPIEKSAGYLGALIEEHVHSALQKGLSVADEILELFDSTHKLPRVVIAAALQSAEHAGWRSLDEDRANPNSMEVSWHSEERRPVNLTPPDRTRMALRADRQRITEDLLTLLRRQYRQ
jgi:hypothetical protein